MRQRILLCGIEDDPHLTGVAQAVEQLGHVAAIWNSRDPNLFQQIEIETPGPTTSAWDAIWVRHLPPLLPQGTAPHAPVPLGHLQKQRALRSFFMQWLLEQKSLGARVWPSLNEGSYDQHKGVQLRLANDVGLKTPRTIVVNRLADALQVSQDPAQELVAKPLIGGAPACLATPQTLEPLLEKFGPVFVQQRVPGTACRVLWCLNQFLGAYRLPETNTIDWRTDPQVSSSTDPLWERIALPPDLHQKIAQLAESQCFELLGIDFMQQGDDFYFLEANPSPAWYDLAATEATRISRSFAELLSNTRTT